MEQQTLFDLTPSPHNGERETTEIEFVQLEFSGGEKREFLLMLDKYCDENKIDNHSDGILLILRKAVLYNQY